MTEPRQRLQVRVTLDSDMGALFAWASAIPERARARELVGMLRVGFAVSAGNPAPSTRSATAIGEPRADASSSDRTRTANSAIAGANLEVEGAEATLLVFDPASVIGVPPP